MLRVDALVGDVVRQIVDQVADVVQQGRRDQRRRLAPSRSAQAAHCSACSSCETPSP